MKKIFFSVKSKSIILSGVLLIFIFMFLYIAIENKIYNHLLDKRIDTLNKDKAAFKSQILSNINNNKLNFKNIESSMKSYSIKNKSRCFLIDKNGNVIIDSFDKYLGKNFIKENLIKKAFNGFSSCNIYEFKNKEKVLYSSIPIISKKKIEFVFLIVKSLNHEELLLSDLKQKYFSVCFILFVFFEIAVYIFMVKLFEPIKHINDHVETEKGNIDFSNYMDIEYLELIQNVNSLISTKLDIEDINKDFISNVSHELKTPVASMKILSDALLINPSDDINIYKDFMADINEELDHLTAIIKSMINLLYLERHEYTLNLEILNIVSIVEHRVNNLKAQANKKNISLSFSSDDSCFIKVDRVKIRQVFDNLINNAIKFTNEGGKIEVSTKIARDYIEFIVKDTGKGLSETELPKIFDKFYMADEARTRIFESSGIGLAVVKEVVNLHSGKIRVESKLGVGTTFFISLPRTRL
ncbi:MAG: hypothetical protein CSB15_01420 [Clostridiales bacterium]|nr:MAG: hypothetical protein CSB15_01420 [Clostridiales bacterium]